MKIRVILWIACSSSTVSDYTMPVLQVYRAYVQQLFPICGIVGGGLCANK